MADISDVTRFLAQTIGAIVYPNGIGQPSVINMDVRVYEGWPIPAQLDLDVGGKVMVSGVPQPRPGGPVVNVSIYPVPGAASPSVYQILDNTYVIVAASYGLSFSINANVITVSGTPVTGEVLTVILDAADGAGGQVCSTSQTNQPTLSGMLADLATQAVNAGYAATSTATTLTIPFKYSMIVRQGGPGTLGKVSHRQRQGIMVTVWAPNYRTRSALAAAIDNVLKQGPQDSPNGCLKFVLPDTTMALLLPSYTTQTDQLELTSIYRRDLVYIAEYATLTEFPGYVITSVSVSISSGEYGSPVMTGPAVVAVK